MLIQIILSHLKCIYLKYSGCDSKTVKDSGRQYLTLAAFVSGSVHYCKFYTILC